jgi:acetyltransferase-like isoleucine patch superfamily enzyme
MRKLYLLLRAIPKTLYFNFKYLPFKQAIRFPFVISHRVWLMAAKGKVHINSHNLSPAMIKIGFGEVSIFDQIRERSVWRVLGEVTFSGGAALGHGTKISVDNEGKLNFGKDVIITAESSIICNKEVNIGDEVMISWETQIMDTDLHSIIDEENNIINNDEKIDIGSKVWIGSRCLILKGAKLEEGSIIAAGTTISKAFEKKVERKSYCLIGGAPPRIIKENLKWIK